MHPVRDEAAVPVTADELARAAAGLRRADRGRLWWLASTGRQSRDPHTAALIVHRARRVLAAHWRTGPAVALAGLASYLLAVSVVGPWGALAALVPFAAAILVQVFVQRPGLRQAVRINADLVARRTGVVLDRSVPRPTRRDQAIVTVATAAAVAVMLWLGGLVDARVTAWNEELQAARPPPDPAGPVDESVALLPPAPPALLVDGDPPGFTPGVLQQLVDEELVDGPVVAARVVERLPVALDACPEAAAPTGPYLVAPTAYQSVQVAGTGRPTRVCEYAADGTLQPGPAAVDRAFGPGEPAPASRQDAVAGAPRARLGRDRPPRRPLGAVRAARLVACGPRRPAAGRPAAHVDRRRVDRRARLRAGDLRRRAR
jgi:hypothetical protein